MKLIIAGSRYFNNYEFLKKSVDNLLSLTFEDIEIISGTCRGTDTLAIRYAKERNYAIKEFPADWSKGKVAGYLRNEQMADYATHCICFWDGLSRGTKIMIDICERRKIKHKIIKY